jgi:hypothetical protein
MPASSDSLTLLAVVADAKPVHCEGDGLKELFSPAVLARTKHTALTPDLWVYQVTRERLDAIIKEAQLPVATATRLQRLHRVSGKRKRACSGDELEDLLQAVGDHAFRTVLGPQSGPLLPGYGPQISGLGPD